MKLESDYSYSGQYKLQQIKYDIQNLRKQLLEIDQEIGQIKQEFSEVKIKGKKSHTKFFSNFNKFKNQLLGTNEKLWGNYILVILIGFYFLTISLI